MDASASVSEPTFQERTVACIREAHKTDYHPQRSDPMPPTTLTELYVEELKDLYSAERQILTALPKMIKAATHEELQDAFEMHRQQTEVHVQRLERILDELGETPRGKKCHGMEGVLEEGSELIQQDPEAAILDAGLIAAAQHVEHYEMAGYGSVRAWARKLGYDEQAELLQETLNEEKETDQSLTQLAEQIVNPDADAETEVPRGKARLADGPARQGSPSRAGKAKETRPSAGNGESH
jgi:ferritin-like metal-binding protein YciE